MTHELYTPNKDDDRVLSFCRSIVPDSQPFYVPVVPEPEFEPLQCLTNVPRKVAMSGGTTVRGWQIHESPKMFFEACFHAVWRSPSGQYVDVTPEEYDEQPEVLFLPDASHSDTEPKEARLRISLAKDSAAVERYWKLLDEAKAMQESDDCGAIDLGSAAMQLHFFGLLNEAMKIRERLQNAT